MTLTGLPATSTSVDELLSLRGDALSRLRNSRRRVRRPKSGLSASAMLGRGLDFAEVRAYQPGDEVRNMDWNVTARTGIAHTKLFVEERELPCFLMVDMRSSMWFATRGMYKSMLAARLAALLGWCAVAANDRVGGIVFTDTGHAEIKPRTGRTGMMQLIRKLAEANAPESAGDEPKKDSGSLDQNFARLSRLARAGGEVFVLSDFAGMMSGETANARGSVADAGATSSANDRLKALAHTGQLTLIQIADPIEQALPDPGRYMVRSRGLRKLLDTNSKVNRQQHRERFEQRIADLQKTVGSNRVYTISTRDHPLDALELILGGRNKGSTNSKANGNKNVNTKSSNLELSNGMRS